MRMRYKYTLLLILLLFSVGLHIATANPDPDHESTSINLGSYTTYVGSNVTVSVEVKNATEIAGGSVKIFFNSSAVNAQAILPGDFGTPVTNINNSTGFVYIACAAAEAVGKDTASLSSIVFKGISKGITALNITDAGLNYENATVFIPETADGKIYVSGAVSARDPIWTRKTGWDVPDVGKGSHPAFVDIDADGDYDLFVGEQYGISFAYENTGSASSPNWTVKPSWNLPDLDMGSKPAFADLDNDGDYDVLIGEGPTGATYGYENTGNATSPNWTANSSWNPPTL